MKRDFMKKLMLISLFFIPYCKAAADQPAAGPYVDPDKGKGKLIEDIDSWDKAVQPFQPIEQRIDLDLAGKEIEAIPDNLNLKLLRLRFLDLARNLITDLPANLPQELVALFLNDNRIAAIPENLPQQLKRLNLAHNQIAIIHENLPQQLEYLNLAHNQISTIPENLPQQLGRLNLDDNRIATIPENWPQQLEYLYLNDNRIAAIPANLPRGMYNLSLANNLIDMIDPQRFCQILQLLPNLRDLDLSGNAISQENVNALRQVAAATRPYLNITADNIGGIALVKPAKVKK